MTVQQVLVHKSGDETQAEERRHLEMMAATIAAGLAADRSTRYLHTDAVRIARAIQEEAERRELD